MALQCTQNDPCHYILSGKTSYHYNDVKMRAMASQITSLTIVYSTVCSSADQRKHQSSASLAFVLGIHRWPVNSPHKKPVTRKMFPFDDVIMPIYLMKSRSREKWACICLIALWHMICVLSAVLPRPMSQKVIHAKMAPNKFSNTCMHLFLVLFMTTHVPAVYLKGIQREQRDETYNFNLKV